MSKQGALIGPEWQRRLRVLWQWKNNIHISGPGVAFKNSDQGLSVCINPKRPTPPIVSSPPPPLAMIRITQNGSAGGQYRGRVQVVDDEWEFDPTEDYSLTDRYNDASTNSADDVYVVAVIDGNSTRRAVPLNSYHWGRRIGSYEGKAVYEIQGFTPAFIASV